MVVECIDPRVTGFQATQKIVECVSMSKLTLCVTLHRAFPRWTQRDYMAQ